MRPFLRLWAFITGRKLVWLQDFDGEVTLATEKRTPFGEAVANRWWLYNISPPVLLLEDGTCKHPYVRRWKYA